MSTRAWKLAMVGTAAIPVFGFAFGGWAVVTVEDLPEYAVAGTPLDLAYTVRQHGMLLRADLSGTVIATAAGSSDTVRASSRAFGSTYRARVTLPHPGDWTFKINSGFPNNSATLLPVRAVSQGPGAQPPAAFSQTERGSHLFVAKGCATCHMRENPGPGEWYQIGPNLTGRQYPADYLATFLADPDKSPLSKTAVGQWRMPNLGLKPAEISALVAFINSDARVATRDTDRR